MTSSVKVKKVINKIVTKDSRYDEEAYEFIGEAVSFTSTKLFRIGKLRKGNHISCEDLLNGIAEYAFLQFGPLAGTVLENWGIKSSQAIGNVVFNMIDENLLAASDDDNPLKFEFGPTFYELFYKPFEEDAVGSELLEVIDS
jgi:uncharacterized repeat protein (TIGR04138 family)